MGGNHGVGIGQFSAILREMHTAREGCDIQTVSITSKYFSFYS